MLPWFKWWRFPAPPKEMLPENGLGGVMVSAGGVDVCAGFLYLTNSKTFWVEYIVSNPEYRDKDRSIGISVLLTELKLIAKSKGMKFGFMSVKNPALIGHLKDNGFIEGSTGTTEMFVVL